MASAPSRYEADMTVIHDPLTKTVLVSFRGKIETLGPFPDKTTAIKEAEEYCRSKGWDG